jgi:glycosyltransferase involved in cell wall biosynthesis
MTKISVVCPVFNEALHMDSVITFFLTAEPFEKELYIIDGGSTDNTIEIVQRYAETHTNIRLIHNPDKYVPQALNKVIPLCKGTYIVRLDAHTEYDASYFKEILETFDRTSASIVGGPMRAIGISPTQKAIAHATSTPFGVGDSSFHYDDVEGEADSVYLGAWKKSIFERTGLFDEEFVRNQDDEFHYRAKSLGFKIWLNPKIKSYYYPRSNLRALWKQYYQYGFYKPMVLSKIKNSMRLRHLIPSLLFLYMLVLPFIVIVAFLYSALFFTLLLPIVLYWILGFFYAFKSKDGVVSQIQCLIVFPILHLSYGSGFLRGIFKVF